MTYKFHKDGTLPQNGEVFVFGSNLAGRHGAGAAKVAIDKFGAIYGQAESYQGNAYAIPTKDENLNVLSLDKIKVYVDEFIYMASITIWESEYFVTAIGCGLAGYNPSDIASMFKDVGSNVSLPDSFQEFLE